MSFLKITDSRIQKLSDFCSDIAQIFFASVFLGPIFSEKTNYLVVFTGLIFSIFAWTAALLLTKE